ncbi:hypothetical protein LZ31DRAFT_560492 [Colletotrichum somersetense]|nr:hypothetical protein LZ31DRAFT_560492 [Colletotrichum somersetense]
MRWAITLIIALASFLTASQPLFQKRGPCWGSSCLGKPRYDFLVADIDKLINQNSWEGEDEIPSDTDIPWITPIEKEDFYQDHGRGQLEMPISQSAFKLRLPLPILLRFAFPHCLMTKMGDGDGKVLKKDWQLGTLTAGGPSSL